eukprot:1621354-Amphidinium_carterae.1
MLKGCSAETASTISMHLQTGWSKWCSALAILQHCLEASTCCTEYPFALKGSSHTGDWDKKPDPRTATQVLPSQ